MASRKLQQASASPQTADPAQDAEQDSAGMTAIPKAGGPTASQQAYGEQGEMQQLRLQMQMDRRSKAMTTVSNLMKGQSDTAQEITKNIK
ncbi:MAG: hypothetical protein JNL83_06605 [Myxococcales bacterium]|nr:hypothetical protein [Myxococcales bacterium]